MATSNYRYFLKDRIFDDEYTETVPMESSEEKKKAAVNPYKARYEIARVESLKWQSRVLELNSGLSQSEIRLIVNRALKQKGLPPALSSRKYPSKTAFVSALSNALFELAQKPDPDVMP